MKDFGYANLFDKPPAVNKRGPASPLDAPRLCTLCRQTRPPDQFYKGKSNRWVCAPCKRHLARESDKKAAYADLKSGRVKPAERLYPNRPVSPPRRLRCTACDKVKPLAGFKINADGWPVGRRCRECVRYTARRRRRGANAAERSALYYQALKEIAEGRYAPYEQRKGRKPAERINRALVEGVKQCNVCLRRKQLDEFKARPALRAGTAACKKCLLQIECTARRAARRGGNSQIARRECRERIRSEAAGG